MKPANVALLALAGMLLTSVSVYSLTPPGGAAGAAPLPVAAELTPLSTSAPGGAIAAAERSRFVDGATLTVEGRVGHPRLLRTGKGGGETFLLYEVRGEGSEGARAAAPVNLSLVMDRSGSMAGTRMQNAVRAAVGAVDRLNDGDVVSVVAFDTRTEVVVPPTTIGPATRAGVAARIQGIGLGGDTCVSCGIEHGLSLLSQTAGRIDKMLLLSDGDTNNGIRDVAGFRALGQRAMRRSAEITTIGVDVNFNEKILTAIAQESNGRHYFVQDDASLARVFEQEAVATTRAVASNAEATIELAPGVELAEVLGRSFRQNGSRVVVPLGTFAKGDVKTVLLRVRVPDRADGEVPLATAELAYRDLLEDRQARCGGQLALELTGDRSRASELDAVVSGRVNRSATAAALREANFLFEQGRIAEAQTKLRAQAQALSNTAGKAKAAAPARRKGDVARDFEKQLDQVNAAADNFAPPKPSPAARPSPFQSSREGRAAVKENAKNILDAEL